MQIHERERTVSRAKCEFVDKYYAQTEKMEIQYERHGNFDTPGGLDA